MKKFWNLSFFLDLLTLATFEFLLLDSIFYYGFSHKHFFVDSKLLLLLYPFITLFFLFYKNISISKYFIKLNKIFLLISTLLSVLFLYLEKTNYQNFIYGYIHINPNNFVYIPILSLIILYIYSQRFFQKTIIYFVVPLIAVFISQSISFNQKINFGLPLKTILINYFLWLTVFLLSVSLFKKRNSSLIIFLSIFTFFNLVNRYKISLWDNYFVISDIYLVKNLNEFLLSTINGIELTKELLLFLVIFIALVYFVKKKVKTNNPSKYSRLFLFLFTFFVLTFPVIFPNQYKKIILRFKIETYIPNPILNCQANGIFFCYYDDFKNINNPAPSNYNQQTIQQIFFNINLTSEKLTSDQLIKPNIIVVLSEAFWDVTNMSSVKFSQDPIGYVRNDIKSTFVSPSYGGGTANVEFELLTGLSNYFLNGKTPYGQTIKRPLPTIFTLFKEKGYYTTTIHPYLGSMYNRKTIYKNFGLDKFLSIEDMSNYDTPNPYVSDEFLNQEIIKQLQSSDQPQLIFALSMQNHVVFEPNRYSQHPITFQSQLDPNEHSILQSYVDGINLTDLSYKNLKSYLKQINKPTIVFFFGDHLTFLGKSDDIYQKTGFEITNNLKKRSTPLAVWSNYQTKFNLPPYISPSFLSLEILKAANITPKYQFLYLNSIKDTDTVISQKIPTKLSTDQISNYELIQYDLIYGKQYSLK